MHTSKRERRIASGAALYTDALKSYDGPTQEYALGIIDRAKSMSVAGLTRMVWKILVTEAQDQRYRRERGTIPPLPVPRRASIPIQSQEAD